MQSFQFGVFYFISYLIIPIFNCTFPNVSIQVIVVAVVVAMVVVVVVVVVDCWLFMPTYQLVHTVYCFLEHNRSKLITKNVADI